MRYTGYIQSGVICKFTLLPEEENKNYSNCYAHGKLEKNHRFCPSCGKQAIQKSFLEDEFNAVCCNFDEDDYNFSINGNELLVKFGSDEDDNSLPVELRCVKFDDDYELYEIPNEQKILETLHNIDLYKSLCMRFKLIEEKVFVGFLHSY